MPKGIKKQPPKKRAYKKKTFTTKELFKEILKEPEPVPSKKNNEIELLAAIVSIFDNWDSEQRSRNLKYLASRYYDFL